MKFLLLSIILQITTYLTIYILETICYQVLVSNQHCTPETVHLSYNLFNAIVQYNYFHALCQFLQFKCDITVVKCEFLFFIIF